MSLKFLAKKSWHTTTLNNVERVWIAEQKAEKEQKKLQELQKQIEEERQIKELRQLQAAAGSNVRDVDTALDWMYQGPQAAENQYADDYLLGKTYNGSSNSAAAGAADATVPSTNSKEPGALWMNKVSSNNDTFTRLHEDPMLMIKKTEKEARDQIVNNPVKMARIKQQLEALSGVKLGAAGNKEGSDGESDSESGSDSSSASFDSREHKKRRKKHKHKHGHHHRRDRHAGDSGSSRRHKHSSGSSSGDKKRRRHHDRHTASNEVGGSSTEPDNHAASTADAAMGSHHAARSAGAVRDGSEERRGEHRDRKRTRTGDAERGTTDEHRVSRDSRDRRDGDRDRRDDRDSRDGRDRRDGDRDRRDDKNSDAPAAKSGSLAGYGLLRKQAPSSEQQSSDRRSLEVLIKEREQKKSAEMQSVKQAQVDRAKGHQKTQRMTEEEKARRLAEMQRDAEVNDELRTKRIIAAHYGDRERATIGGEAEEGTSSSGGSASFLHDMRKDIYSGSGSGGGAATMSERLQQNKHYIQKGADLEDSSYKKFA